VEESAEGIVGRRQAKLLRHSNAERRSNREAKSQRHEPKARTVPREGIESEEK
jgi:hypothetical protein